MEQENLMEYISRILAEHEELSLEGDTDLLATAAEIMAAGDERGCPCSVEEAITDAMKELSGETEKRAAAARETLKREMELRGNPVRSGSELFAKIMAEEKNHDSGKKVGNPVNAIMAKAILKNQAESLWAEQSLKDIHYFEDGNLWRAVVRFKNGNLSAEAQQTLKKMKHNAHRTMYDHNNDLEVVTFIVAG